MLLQFIHKVIFYTYININPYKGWLHMSDSLPITEFDMITLNQTTQMFKALVPFLDYPLQRSISIFIRINELQQTMRFYNHPDNIQSFSSCNSDFKPIHSFSDIMDNPKIIDEVLKYCPKNYVSMFNNIRQFSKMSDLFNLFGSMENDAGNFNFSGSQGSSGKTGHFTNSNNSESSGNVFFNNMPKPLFNSFFKPEQQKMYDQYIKQLDKLDFDNIKE